MHTTILGCGYSGLCIARELAVDGAVTGTRRGASGLTELEAAGVQGIRFDPDDEAVSEALREALAGTTHLLSSVAPARTLPLEDAVLDAVAPLLLGGALPALEWIGYLSTIGVYGNHDGGPVDEDTACTSIQPRSIARREAELAWCALGRAVHVPVAVLRLSGIYGPGRNAVRDALAGRARMLIKPGQVFNRIHVADLACATALAARAGYDGVLNVTDDEPAAPEDVIRFAHSLVERPPPPAIPFDEADISPMARSFYAESKRVDNVRSKRVLGLQYRYPNYRVGLSSLVDGALADAHESARDAVAAPDASDERARVRKRGGEDRPIASGVIVVRELASLAELEHAERFQRDVWGEDDKADNADIMLAIQHEGGLIAGAFAGTRMIGFLFGFPTRDPRRQHSHRLAVHPDSRGLGLGARLKWYQRDWCLERGIERVVWTYDPLLGVNAALNIERLGAHADVYHEDYYGAMPGINAGAPSDRLLADWELEAPEVVRLARGESREPAPGVPPTDPSIAPHRSSESVVTVAIPADFTAMLAARADAARAERLRVRDELQRAFPDGFRITRYDAAGCRYTLVRRS